MLPLVQIDHLDISFQQDDKTVQAIAGISLQIHRGRLTAIVGESGSGKSVSALSIMQLLPGTANIQGHILFSPDGLQQQDLLKTSSKDIRKIRGNEIAMIFQEPMTSLNPVYTCGNQVTEAILQHKKISRKQAKLETLKLFEQVELPDPATMYNRFPHQLSGGQKQRVMIAMAMSCAPALLIADEPTTALDVRVQKNILELIKKLQTENGMSVLLITHDLGLVADLADEVVVLYKGKIVEQGITTNVLSAPQHAYTKALLACRPAANAKGTRLPVISDFLPAIDTDNQNKPEPIPVQTAAPKDVVALSVQDLLVQYPARKNFLGKTLSVFNAVDDVSFNVMKNETVGLVGESGCGKTTLGRAILQLTRPTSGKILMHGKDIASLPKEALRILRKDLQVVFQDPYGSLNPRISIGDAIMEPLKVHALFNTNKERKEKAVSLLEKVSLDADYFNRYPHQFSGGQRQRICIARALALDPSFLVFDESVSALDVSVQAQVLNLISDLKAEMNFTSIFISHDLSVVHYISDRILVMNKGKIVESGTADDVFLHPKDVYTQQLIAAIPGKKLH